MDSFLSSYLFRIAVVILLILLVLRCFGLSVKRLHHMAYAAFINRLSFSYNKLMGKQKEKLFSSLSDIAKGKPITILEIGAGSGANFKYYPDKSFVICIEPKPDFERYIDQNSSEFPRLRVEFVSAVAEDMRSVPSESVDAVVTTLVLCSVGDIPQALQEVLRVLKPGGRLYFMEHVSSGDGSWLESLQNLLTPVSRVLADGCHFNRKTWEYIEQAGFAHVDYERITTKSKFVVIKPHLVGTATK